MRCCASAINACINDRPRGESTDTRPHVRLSCFFHHLLRAHVRTLCSILTSRSHTRVGYSPFSGRDSAHHFTPNTPDLCTLEAADRHRSFSCSEDKRRENGDAEHMLNVIIVGNK